jgi:glycerol-3-phosphate dehydrogenase (NAD(P)+)
MTSTDRVKIGVIGAGSWGTALAALLHRNGHDVALWSHEPGVVKEVQSKWENRVYLPGVRIPPEILISTRLRQVVPDADVIVSVSPAQYVGSVMEKVGPLMRDDATVVSASKGIETGTLLRMDELMAPLIPEGASGRFVVLSGPSFALEVAQGVPTAVVAASLSEESGTLVQELFGSATFRVYTSDDVVGVELAGAIKNVIALAAGVCAGLELGHNAQAALVTRGLAEITRLGVAMGAQASTFYGLAGLGDLVLTCTGPLSRNRTVGVRLGQGETLERILEDMPGVAEGVATAPAVQRLAGRHGVEMPIVNEVCAILEGERTPEDAVRELMIRAPRPES